MAHVLFIETTLSKLLKCDKFHANTTYKREARQLENLKLCTNVAPANNEIIFSQPKNDRGRKLN